MELVRPGPSHLASYVDALERGWSPDTRHPAAGAEELLRIAEDATGFLDALDDPTGSGPPVTLPDGGVAPRLPGYRRFIWDGDFCGSVSFRWQPGTVDLPVHVPGHIGYSVVPWKRRRGYATRALALLLHDVSSTGLPFVELSADVDNAASVKVIEANGGRLVERVRTARHTDVLRYAIDLRT